jgi:hypothetical protein
MKTEATGSPGEVLPPINTLIAYEDQFARDHTLQVFGHLIPKFRSELEFSQSWWGFYFLHDPILARQAAREAVTADMIVFSTRSGAELPGAIRQWTESWVNRRQRRFGAIVGLHWLPSATAVPSPCEEYLREVARRADMDYLQPEDTFAYQHRLEQRHEAMTPVLAAMLDSTPAWQFHWGIND